MNRKAACNTLRMALSFGLGVGVTCAASAATMPGPGTPLPGAADVGRIKPEESQPLDNHSRDGQAGVSAPQSGLPIPDQAKQIHFVLKHLTVSGATVYTQDQFTALYASDLNKNISLSRVYEIANAITAKYRKAGYFLSLAYVPDQSIAGGQLTIRVVEGYIGKVEIPGDAGSYSIVQHYVDALLARHPVKSDEVENFLLRVNDLPGLSFQGILSRLDKTQQGVVKLTLLPGPSTSHGSLSFDNYSSRYLGPNEMSATYSTSLLPLQQTMFTTLSSLPLPVSNMRYGTLTHMVAVAPDTTVQLTASRTKVYPGYTLGQYDIDSLSDAMGISAHYQYIRQRHENLSFSVGMDGNNVTSDILHAPLTRDRIRAARAGISYDITDRWQGYNTVSATLSHGLSWLGASGKYDPYLSRAHALPDFTKLDIALSRLQGLAPDWSLLASVSGQTAVGVLYSSEEFGYGGQAFGRAYDASELIGDQGMSGSLELRYDRWDTLLPLAAQPYTFLDAGALWSNANTSTKRQVGSSAGFGLRLTSKWDQTANIAVAWPLDRNVGTPIYGSNPSGPRISLQLVQNF